MKKKVWAAAAGLSAAALFLRFALRGYAWWGYLCLFAAALLLLHAYLPVTLWRVVVALTCVGFAYFCFVEYFIIKNARTDRDPGRDYLIVLGAAVYKDQPSLTLVRRLEGALDYLETYPDSVAIVSGGMGPGETVTEAQAMYDCSPSTSSAPAGTSRPGRSPSSRAPTTSTAPSAWRRSSASRTPRVWPRPGAISSSCSTTSSARPSA